MAVDPARYEQLVRRNASLEHGIPEALLADVPVDRVEDHARQLAQHVTAARQAPAGAPSVAGVPVPSDNATRAAESEEQRRIREGQYKIRQRLRPGARGGRTLLEPWEAEELRDMFFRISWNSHMEHRRTGRGNISEPPRGAPAVPALPAPGRSF